LVYFNLTKEGIAIEYYAFYEHYQLADLAFLSQDIHSVLFVYHPFATTISSCNMTGLIGLISNKENP